MWFRLDRVTAIWPVSVEEKDVRLCKWRKDKFESYFFNPIKDTAQRYSAWQSQNCRRWNGGCRIVFKLTAFSNNFVNFGTSASFRGNQGDWNHIVLHYRSVTENCLPHSNECRPSNHPYALTKFAHQKTLNQSGYHDCLCFRILNLAWFKSWSDIRPSQRRIVTERSSRSESDHDIQYINSTNGIVNWVSSPSLSLSIEV
jgi:hypothetical protein